MKISVIEDAMIALDNLAETLVHDGHEVQSIHVVDSEDSFFQFMGREEGIIYCGTPKEIVAAVAAFQPDRVLLDHDLKMKFTGKDVAEALQLPRERIIGTSTHFDQKYAARIFRLKGMLSRRPEEEYAQQLLAMLE